MEQHTEEHHSEHDELWRKFFVEGIEAFNGSRKIFQVLPSNPRCRVCNAPFSGVGSVVTRLVFGKTRSNMNPQMCNACESMATTKPGGAEFELSMLFADVRGSTTIAEQISPSEFTRLMNRFYFTATDVLSRADGMLNRFVGDEVIAFFVPGIAGPAHAQHAMAAARHLLEATGNTGQDKPWLPIGIGIHTGVAYMGVVGGKGGAADITALGDAVNVGARLASNAGAGEILASDALCSAANFSGEGLEHRDLALKGRKEKVGVRVIRA